MPSRTRHSLCLIAPLLVAASLFAADPLIENDQVRVVMANDARITRARRTSMRSTGS
jgi:hypothetical protein